MALYPCRVHQPWLHHHGGCLIPHSAHRYQCACGGEPFRYMSYALWHRRGHRSVDGYATRAWVDERWKRRQREESVCCAITQNAVQADDAREVNPVGMGEKTPGSQGKPRRGKAEQTDGERRITDVPMQLKFVFPNSLSGCIIGKDGANLENIEKKTGAFVQANARGTCVESQRDRLITVAGKTMDVCLFGFEELMHSIREQQEKMTWKGRVVLRQVIPGSCAGRVLGVKGQRIAEMREQMGVRCVVERVPEHASMVPFRLVNYSADSLDSLISAVVKVSHDVAEGCSQYGKEIKEVKSVVLKVVEVPEKRLGALLGPKGKHVRTMEDVLRCKMSVVKDESRSCAYVSVWGQPENVRVASEVCLLGCNVVTPSD